MNAMLDTDYQPSETFSAATSEAKTDRISRDEWERDRRAELELAALKRRIRESSYLPEAADCFYIH